LFGTSICGISSEINQNSNFGDFKKIIFVLILFLVKYITDKYCTAVNACYNAANGETTNQKPIETE